MKKESGSVIGNIKPYSRSNHLPKKVLTVREGALSPPATLGEQQSVSAYSKQEVTSAGRGSSFHPPLLIIQPLPLPARSRGQLCP